MKNALLAASPVSFCVLLCLSACVVEAAPIIEDGLVAMYRFEDNADDIGANEYDGVEFNGISYGVGVHGQAAVFDGVDDRIQLPHDAMNGLSDFTFSVWINMEPRGAISNPIISAANSSVDNEFMVYYNIEGYGDPEDTFGASVGQHDLFWSDISLAFDSWHHLTVTRDTTLETVSFYIDGSLEYEQSWSLSDPLDVDLSGLWLGGDQDSLGGGWNSSQQFFGAMDEIAIHDRVLTGAEIEYLAAVPEPATMVIFGCLGAGMAAAGKARRRKRG